MNDIRFRPFQAHDLDYMDLQQAQRSVQRWLSREGYGEYLEEPELSWSAVAGDLVVGCAGIKPQWQGRAVAWSLIDRRMPRSAWVKITREVQRILQLAHDMGYRRIEATVLAGHGEGCRWMDVLGFKVEGKATAYDPAGNDHYLYARVAPCPALSEEAA